MINYSVTAPKSLKRAGKAPCAEERARIVSVAGLVVNCYSMVITQSIKPSRISRILDLYETYNC